VLGTVHLKCGGGNFAQLPVEGGCCWRTHDSFLTEAAVQLVAISTMMRGT
jgi:hypothetical protein